MVTTEILVGTLAVYSTILILIFVSVWEKFGKLNRNIEYESGRAKYWHNRYEIIDQKMSNLYAKDQHSFERPKVDMVVENADRTYSNFSQRLYKVENEKRDSK